MRMPAPPHLSEDCTIRPGRILTPHQNCADDRCECDCHIQAAATERATSQQRTEQLKEGR